MRIRTKLLGLVLLVAACFAVIFGLTVRTYLRLSSMRDAIDRGSRLIAQSRLAHGLVKDVVFDLFSPRIYSSLQGIVLAPRSLATLRELDRAAADFRASYEAFMADPELRGLLADEELKAAFEVAGPMSERAFRELADLRTTIERIREAYPDEPELYSRIQQSKDERLYAVFDRVREASFYLGNIFESYLNRFVSGLERQARAVEGRLLAGYAIASLLVVASAVAAVFLMTTSILANLRAVDRALERLSEGDFSARVAPKGHDELGALAGRVNLFSVRLKRNVDALTSLLGEVNQAIPEAPDLDRILAIVTGAILREGVAECAAVFLAEGGAVSLRSWSGFAPVPGGGQGCGAPKAVAESLERGTPVVVVDAEASAGRMEELGLDPGLRSLAVHPMFVKRKASGAILFARLGRPFTDLELSQCESFADYAAQVIENAAASAALVAHRDAEYQALQAQIRPHFIYNVLNGLVALNRMGERQSLESSLHALKDMLRYILEHQRWATVAEESAFLERYLRLQKLRFEDRLGFELDIAADAAALRVPKLIVHPLVENAVIHGIEPLPGPGRVHVSARLQGGMLVLRVEDDGAGCDPGAIDERARVGIGNVRERLGLLYRSASLELAGAPGAGFSAEIRIPLSELEA